MKMKTLNTLNYAAKVISDDILSAARDGVVCRVEVKSCNDPQNKNELISIRETIRHMSHHFSYITGVKLSNVIKTTQQFNYIANEVLNKLRRTGWFFKTDFKTAALQQTEFNFN